MPSTWDEVIDKAVEKITAKQQAKEVEIQQELENVNNQINDLKKDNPDLDEDALWAYMESNKTLNVYEAFIKTSKNTKSDEAKQVASKVGSNVQNTTGKTGISYDQLHKMDLDDIQLPGS